MSRRGRTHRLFPSAAHQLRPAGMILLLAFTEPLCVASGLGGGGQPVWKASSLRADVASPPGSLCLCTLAVVWGQAAWFPEKRSPSSTWGRAVRAVHVGLRRGPGRFTSGLEVETPPRLAQPCQNKQAGCTLLPKAARKREFPGSSLEVACLHRCSREEGSSGRGAPACTTPPKAAVAGTGALAERDASGGTHRRRKAHPRRAPGAFRGQAVARLFPRASQAQGCRGGLWQGVEIFQPLGLIFPVCVS